MTKNFLKSFAAKIIVITEKDAVKIPKEVACEDWSIPIFVIRVEVKFQTGAEEFQAELCRRLAEKTGKKIEYPKRGDLTKNFLKSFAAKIIVVTEKDAVKYRSEISNGRGRISSGIVPPSRRKNKQKN